jgi:hypothetical protein
VAHRVGRVALWVRILMFVAVLGSSAGIAVISAHQEDSGSGIGIAIIGFIVQAGVLWFVAWLRGAWRLAHGKGSLGVFLAGLVAVTTAGSTAVSEVVLTARGELVDVVVAAQTAAYEDGDRVYLLAPVSGSIPVRGSLHTKRNIDDGQTVTVLVDRDGFVRPMLPEDMATTLFVIIVLAGVGLLAAIMIGSGFPLSASRDQDGSS